MNPVYSIIVPVYNRPGELAELLESLALQTFRDFEVIIAEDGSDVRSDELVRSYEGRLNVRYLDLPRSGPSVARNLASEAATGNYLVYVDSDCILPDKYLESVDTFLSAHPLDFFGGPDRAAGYFNRSQKAISYAMTSFLTTGGIRGGKRQVDKFHPRSFNMGVTRQAFDSVGGYPVTRMHPGEDMVLSIELIKRGFRSGLIPEAFVYHKRRTTLGKFWKQVYGFGKTRLIISRVYPETFRLFFLAPSLFLLGSLLLGVLSALAGWWFLLPLITWALLLLADASLRNRSLVTGAVSLMASLIQLYGYGWGFLKAAWQVGVLGRDEYGVFSRGFYPGR